MTRLDSGGRPGVALVEQVGRAVRRMGAQTVLTSRTVAERFGLHPTDLECLDLIFMGSGTTSSDLAKATGLTSGAMTAVIDRLEGAGYVVRVPDPEDRRRHRIHVQAEAIGPLLAAYAPMQTAMIKLWKEFRPGELRVILDFLTRSTDLAVQCAETIAQTGDAVPGRRRSPRMSRRSHRQEPTSTGIGDPDAQ
jgi:DNA-binding MarR family transcriptional regulator